jgi:hypothetical protein
VERAASFRHSRLSRSLASGGWGSPTPFQAEVKSRLDARFSMTGARDWEGKSTG